MILDPSASLISPRLHELTTEIDEVSALTESGLESALATRIATIITSLKNERKREEDRLPNLGSFRRWNAKDTIAHQTSAIRELDQIEEELKTAMAEQVNNVKALREAIKDTQELRNHASARHNGTDLSFIVRASGDQISIIQAGPRT